MSTFDSLDKTFDMSPAEIVPVEEAPKPVKAKQVDRDKHNEKDYEYQRAQLYNIVEKMNEALDGAMEVAAESDHPRAYEVVFNGAKNAADVVEKIGDLHKKMKDLDEQDAKVTQHTNGTTNNVFMTGSTADLLKMLKDNK